MKAKRLRIWHVAVLLLVVMAGFTAYSYNRLVRADEAVKLAWGELQNLYGRRADLVPTLVTIVQGAAAFEKSLLQELTEARSKATALQVQQPTAGNFAAQEQAQGNLAVSMSRVLAVVEAYPDVKATKSFLYLQTQLEGTERRIKVARKDFNTAVQQYNTLVRSFPVSLTARMFGFRLREGFTADTEAAPEVKF